VLGVALGGLGCGAGNSFLFIGPFSFSEDQAMGHRAKRLAFTLVELLVVIAIIGVLVALLLPAVQAARESARRMQCANNLKQIGLALMNYHDTNKWFPPGSVWATNTPVDDPRNKGSMFIRILPYIEQQALYQLFDFNKSTDQQRMTSASTSPLLRGQVVPSYLCPSDTSRATGTAPNQIMPASYHTSTGPSSAISNNSASSCPLYSTFQKYSRASTPVTAPPGPFSRSVWYQCRMSDFIDGLSNTILVGEARGECSAHMAGGWSASSRWGAFTQVPINFDTCRTQAVATAEKMDSCYANNNWNAAEGFKSLHPGGAQFVFGDGSVRFIPQNVDMVTYNYLGDKADRKAVNLP
jgi:prepilin-type N-terminal cleavage/methylation domain-containing protein/prepilin-type processing-associated H-X9-DG protein